VCGVYIIDVVGIALVGDENNRESDLKPAVAATA